MLNKLRNFSKGKLAGVLVGIIIIPFVFWGMGSVFSGGNTNSIAKINNLNVSTQDFSEFINNSKINPEIIRENIENNVLEELLAQLVSAKLIEIEIENLSVSISDEVLASQIKKQKELQSKVCERSDIVITTAQLFGRPAPLLIDNNTIDKMSSGSVIFDMAVESGGNVEGSKVDEIVEVDGVKIVGISNLASKVAGHASYALSNNFNNWLLEFYDEESKNIRFDFEDEIISSSVLVFDGEVKNERFK